MGYWEDQKVLVTGGCGMIGSYLVEELVGAGAEVYIVDNLDRGKLENIASVLAQVYVKPADLRDLGECLAATKGMDVVMNLAAQAHGLGFNYTHQGETLYNNTILAMNMLEAAHLNEVERFLVVSSSLVYDDDTEPPLKESEWNVAKGLTGGGPDYGNRGYGWAKRLAEIQATYYAEQYGMGIAIVRPASIYGGRYRWLSDKSHAVPDLVRKVAGGDNPMVIWGSGEQRRNFVHGRDAARIMMLVTELYACCDPVNLGYEETVTLNELVDVICNVANVYPEIIHDTTKPEGRLLRSMDSTLLRAVTGYTPEISLPQGIGEVVDAFRRQQ